MSKASPCNQRRLRVRLRHQAEAAYRQLQLTQPVSLAAAFAWMGQMLRELVERFRAACAACEALRELFARVLSNAGYLEASRCPDCGDDMASGYFDPTALCARHRP